MFVLIMKYIIANHLDDVDRPILRAKKLVKDHHVKSYRELVGVKGIGTIGLPIFKWSNTEVSLGSHSVTSDRYTEGKGT